MDFETKIKTVISKVAWSIGIDIGDRLVTGARKLKFVVNGPLPAENVFADGFRDFEVRNFQGFVKKKYACYIHFVLNSRIFSVGLS